MTVMYWYDTAVPVINVIKHVFLDAFTCLVTSASVCSAEYLLAVLLVNCLPNLCLQMLMQTDTRQILMVGDDSRSLHNALYSSSYLKSCRTEP